MLDKECSIEYDILADIKKRWAQRMHLITGGNYGESPPNYHYLALCVYELREAGEGRVIVCVW